jgi:hypothetical protein
MYRVDIFIHDFLIPFQLHMTVSFEWDRTLAIKDEEETVGPIPRCCSPERLKETTRNFI